MEGDESRLRLKTDPGLPSEQQIKGREKIQEDNPLRPESLRQAAAGGHGDEEDEDEDTRQERKDVVTV